MKDFIMIKYNDTTKALTDGENILAKIRSIKKRSGGLRVKVEPYGKVELPHSITKGEYMELDNAKKDLIKFFKGE